MDVDDDGFAVEAGLAVEDAGLAVDETFRSADVEEPEVATGTASGCDGSRRPGLYRRR